MNSGDAYATRTKTPGPPPVIVVGAGPVGIRFVEELARIDSRRSIKLFSGEACKPYDRVKLSLLLAHDINENDIYSRFNGGEHLELVENCQIVAINRADKRVQDKTGQWHSYSKLVLALGSYPLVPGIQNIHCKNVFTFRDLKDTEALAARNLTSRHTVIIGGGLLGVETARAMQRNHTRVTLVQMAGHLMNQQLDRSAGAILELAVRKLGIDVICNARVTAIIADSNDYNTAKPQVGGVKLDTGVELVCDTVIVATGIKPRIELALEHGLSVGRGIRVNAQLQTSDPDIYAIGECVQFGEQLFGLVAPGWEHAAIAAHHISGEDAVYQGSIAAASLKVVGEQVFSVGSINPELSGSIKPTVYTNAAAGLHRAVFTVNNRLTGALAIGAWPEQHRVRASINEGRTIGFWNLLRFRCKGFLWPEQQDEDIRQWPANMVVCNCTGVTRGQLSAACSNGAASLDALIASTRAATVCGSCKPLLAGFVGSAAPASATPQLHWLLGVSVLCLSLLLLLLLTGPLPYSTSVQLSGLDQLWIDGFTKQVTGFTLLGVATFSLLMSLSKRLRWLRLGKFTSWRLFHTVLGVSGVVVLLLHTGIQLGVNLNRWLMLDFVLLLLAGAMAGVVIGREHRLAARTAKQARSWLTWTHTLLFWPLPVLLGFHVLSVYYF